MGTSLNISAWSTTAADNDTADSGLPAQSNSMTPTQLDDTNRGIMASIKRYANDIGGAITSAGTANALTITTARSISSGHQAAGFSVRFKAGNTNTGAATVAVDGLTAVAIKRMNGDDLGASDIIAGGMYDIAFDGTNYVLMGANPATGDYGTLAGGNTWSGANVFTSSVTVGDGAGDVVVIKGTTVHSFMSGILNSSSAQVAINNLLTETFTGSINRIAVRNASLNIQLATPTTVGQTVLKVIGNTKGNILIHNGTDWAALAPP